MIFSSCTNNTDNNLFYKHWFCR